jgi:hypothetical protein
MRIETRRDLESRDFAAADAFMQSLKEEPIGEPNLPNAEFLWLKAQVMQQQKLAERASEPMTFFQRLSYLVVALCWAAAITWKWPTLDSLTELSFSGITSSALMTMVMFLGLVSLTAALTLHSVFAGE